MHNRFKILVLFLVFSFSTLHYGVVYTHKSYERVKSIKGIDRVALIDFAKQYLGTSYCSAGQDPEKGFDCSGFVYFVFKKFHIEVPRSSIEFQFLGKALQPEEFRVGDVVVFYGYRNRNSIGHVGIICEAKGMNSRFIHASSGIAYAVIISDLNSTLYKTRYYKCIDVIDP
jgi:cell wall-associated NlpC family hydrolase